MHEALRVYFDGEKHAGVFIAGLGAITIAGAAVMLRARLDLRAFAITVGVVALLLVALGVGLYLKTGPQVTELARRLDADRPALLADEGARMARVQRNFVILEWAWIALILATATAAVTLKHRPGFSGVALGLLFPTVVLLCFDLVAERRGAVYLTALRSPDA